MMPMHAAKYNNAFIVRVDSEKIELIIFRDLLKITV